MESNLSLFFLKGIANICSFLFVCFILFLLNLYHINILLLYLRRFSLKVETVFGTSRADWDKSYTESG